MSSAVNKKNTIIKDALILFAITLISGFALGLVHEITLPAIEMQQIKAKTEAYRTVYPEAAEFKEDSALALQAEESAEVLSSNGYEKATIDEALIAVDASGNKIGYVLTLTTQEGYKGGIAISLGYGLDGILKGMEVVTINETAGLGAKAAENSFKSQFINKKADKFEYTKTGAAADNQIDAISGATITSSAVVNEVNAGICFITDLVEIIKSALIPKLYTPNKPAGIKAIATSCIILVVVIQLRVCGEVDTLYKLFKSDTSFYFFLLSKILFLICLNDCVRFSFAGHT